MILLEAGELIGLDEKIRGYPKSPKNQCKQQWRMSNGFQSLLLKKLIRLKQFALNVSLFTIKIGNKVIKMSVCQISREICFSFIRYRDAD